MCAEFGDGGEVDRGVLADRGVRAAAGLDAEDAFGRERAGAGQELGVLLGVDVVGDRGDVVVVAEALAERIHQRGLAGADGAADADAEGTVWGDHERNSLVYWVSCFMEAMSARSAAPPRSSRRCGRRRVGNFDDDRTERGDDALAVGLADGNGADAGRDDVGDESGERRGERRRERHVMGGGACRHGDGVGDSAGSNSVGERGNAVVRPGGGDGGKKRAPLRGRFEVALLRRLERGGEFGDGEQRRSSPALRHA